MNILTEGLRGAGELFALSARLLARHWPQLLTLYFAGAAGRMAFLWLAVLVSKSSALLAALIVPLAPLCTLLSLVVMLRVCADSLPILRVEGTAGNFDTRWKANLRVAAQALIPFLAVYALQGLLTEDSRYFIYSATADELQNNLFSANFARTLYANGWALVVMVLTAMTLRKWLSLRRLPEKSVGWGLVGGYVEALWLVALGAALTSQLGDLKDWVMSRALVNDVLAWQTGTQTASAFLPKVLGQAFMKLAEVLGSLGNLIILPVAWLVVGALIYGSKLTNRDLPIHEQVTARLRLIPHAAQRLVAQAVEPVTTPIQNTVKAMGMVASPGLLKMVLYCVAFALTGSVVKVLVSLAARSLIGPRESGRSSWLEAAQPYILLLERGAYLTISVVMVAAAVSHILLAERKEWARAQAAALLPTEAESLPTG